MSVRGNIIAAIMERLRTISGVGAVTDPGDGEALLAQHVDKHVLEVAALDDGQSPEPSNLEVWSFEVVVGVYLPTKVAGSWQAAAADICAAIYAAYAGPDVTLQQWNGLARKTECRVMSSAVMLSDSGRRCVMHVFEVTYGHPWGNAGSAA